MRALRVLGAAVLGASVALVLIGAGSASATRLCSAATNPCPMENRWLANVTIASAVSTPAQVATNLGTMSCMGSTLGGKTTNGGGGAGVTVTTEFSSFTLTGCKIGATACTVTTASLPYAGAINWTAGFDGNLKVSNGGSGNPKFVAECGAILKCTFTSPVAEFGVTGGVTAQFVANGIPLSREGLLCPSVAKFTATYEVSSPGPLQIAQE